jgi:hypothetical protein
MNDLARNYFLSTYAGESHLRHTRAKDRRNPRESRTRQKFVCNWLRKSLCLSCRLGYFLRREREIFRKQVERSRGSLSFAPHHLFNQSWFQSDPFSPFSPALHIALSVIRGKGSASWHVSLRNHLLDKM